LWAGDASLFFAYKKAGRLTPYSPPEAKTIPPDLKDPDGHFHAVRLLHLVIAYNDKSTGGVPGGFRDILPLMKDSKKRARVFALPSPESSGASLAAFIAWSQASSIGWNFIRGLASIEPKFTGNFRETADLLASGVANIALLTDRAAYGFGDNSPNIKVVWPAEGAVAISGPAGILRKKKESAGARLLIRFLLSEAAQRTISEEGLYAARADIAPPDGRPPLGELKRMPVKWEKTMAAEKIVLRRFRALQAIARRKAAQNKK
jgi:ABC-type Fe3+ transport system substrate-binding protein